MDKKQRQRAILKIISSQEVETQEQLGELLAEAGTRPRRRRSQGICAS